MATKQNMFAKCKPQVKNMNSKYEQITACSMRDADRNPITIVLGFKQKAIVNRDAALETKGMLEALISGLDKNSNKLPLYQNCLYKCDAIIRFADGSQNMAVSTIL